MSRVKALPRSTFVATSIILVGFVGLAILDARSGTIRDEFVVQTMVWYGVAFVGFLGAVWLNEKTPIPMAWIWGAAIVFRLLLLTTLPTLSDDVFRYVWEGHLLSEGVSPYQSPIFAPELDEFAIPIRELVNNPTFASPYLPVTHAVFTATSVVLGDSVLGFQIVMTLLELGTAWGLLSLLKIVNIAPRRILLWLWNPIVVVEIAHGAHLDAIMIFFTIAALVATFHPKVKTSSLAGPILLGLATLTRPIPVLLTPVLFWRWNWPQRLAYAATLVIGIAPFAIWSGLGIGNDENTGVFGSGEEYTETFRFNSAIYQALEQWVGSQGLDDRGLNEPRLLTMIIIFAGYFLFMAWVWNKARSRHDAIGLLRLAAFPIVGYTLTTPVFHPWYVLLLVALLLFHTPREHEAGRRWFALLPWAWLTATLVISYITYEDPNFFFERAWVRRVEWWPTLALGAGVFLAQKVLFTRYPKQLFGGRYSEPSRTAADLR